MAEGDMAAAVAEAFAGSSPEPAGGSTVDSASVSTSETPTEETPHAQTQEPGPVPYGRFREVNESAQLSKRELEQLAWAKGIQREHGEHLAAFYNRVRENPLSLLEHEVNDLLSNPQTAAQVRSWAARTLGTRMAGNAGSLPQDTGEPQPDIELQDGSLTYSAAQLQARDAWRDAQMDSRIDQRIKPIQQFTEKQVAAQIKEQATRDATAQVTALKANPHFETHKGDVRELMLKNDRLSLEQAWAQVFIEKVIPKLSATSAAGLQQKVSAGSANPARPSGAAAGPPKDFHEALTRALGKS